MANAEFPMWSTWSASFPHCSRTSPIESSGAVYSIVCNGVRPYPSAAVKSAPRCSRSSARAAIGSEGSTISDVDTYRCTGWTRSWPPHGPAWRTGPGRARRRRGSHRTPGAAVRLEAATFERTSGARTATNAMWNRDACRDGDEGGQSSRAPCATSASTTACMARGSSSDAAGSTTAQSGDRPVSWYRKFHSAPCAIVTMSTAFSGSLLARQARNMVRYEKAYMDGRWRG
ncbi:hypothetical protein PBRA_005991 [Plasmodiophora brassicae]|uniref:Uncharacterized protein n=1 Tax=Plasmodiophora brassicae TaxID=37360 RepID=A0A0G4IRQ6_PLABS|nr:hypothetical protein PBRA_005991 [Plasmodiophora brassicae]